MCALALCITPALGAPAQAPRATDKTVKSPIEGPTWRLMRLGERDAPGDASRPITARFESGQVDGFSGCNHYGGGYTLAPGQIVLGKLRMTMMACVGSGMEIEEAFTRAFSGTLAYRVDADTLTLTPGSGDALTFRAEPAPTLAGVTWKVTGYNNGRQAVVSPIAGSTLKITFGDGEVQGESGCNSFRASVKVEGDRIRIGAPAVTRKTCPGEGVMRQELDLLAALQSSATWLIRDGMLELRRASGERALTARVAPR